MKIISTLIILFIANNALAKEPAYKAWINFQSDYGYEFKYPDCWEMQPNSPDEDGTVFTKMRNISVTEKTCITKQRDKYVPNIMTFNSHVAKNEKELNHEISIIEKSSKFQLENKSWLLFKKLRINGGGEAIMYVEQHDKWQKQIRWIMKLFCTNREVYISGVPTTNPSKELLQKFERGDLAIPEPEKTVFESIRCIEPKLK